MKKDRGFTLIELLIVIAVIGILFAISLPAYQEHIRKSSRVVAIFTLTKLAQQFERENARQGIYPGSLPADTNTDTYNFTLPVTTDNTFQITATAIGNSASDDCGNLSINQAGQTSSSIGTGCWD